MKKILKSLNDNQLKKLNGDATSAQELKQPVKVDTNSTKCFIKYTLANGEDFAASQLTGSTEDLLIGITAIISHFAEQSSLPIDFVLAHIYQLLLLSSKEGI